MRLTGLEERIANQHSHYHHRLSRRLIAENRLIALAACGAVRETLSLRVRTWACAECGVVHDQDVNAARNLLHQSTVGVTGSNAWGQPVRPEFAAAAGQAG